MSRCSKNFYKRILISYMRSNIIPHRPIAYDAVKNGHMDVIDEIATHVDPFIYKTVRDKAISNEDRDILDRLEYLSRENSK